jgi:hypothetical protein
MSSPLNAILLPGYRTATFPVETAERVYRLLTDQETRL